METKLARISQLSSENPDMVFTPIGYLINKGLLRECHQDMDGKKAVGIDGITKEEYEKELEGNLENLERQLKQKAYKPKPARRVEIPKENGKTRIGLFSDYSKYIYALCAVVVVRGEGEATDERLCRNRSICGRLCSEFSIQVGCRSIL